MHCLNGRLFAGIPGPSQREDGFSSPSVMKHAQEEVKTKRSGETLRLMARVADTSPGVTVVAKSIRPVIATPAVTAKKVESLKACFMRHETCRAPAVLSERRSPCHRSSSREVMPAEECKPSPTHDQSPIPETMGIEVEGGRFASVCCEHNRGWSPQGPVYFGATTHVAASTHKGGAVRITPRSRPIKARRT